MRRPIRPNHPDLFSAPPALPGSLPALPRAELVSFLRSLLLEVISHQRQQLKERQETHDE